ncbi:MAG TPA: metal-dependent hydrolase [Candidatus Polarisedimenticolaceae bacterium]|nr:metal-dependent hydrolase [Candidatus Polarisedimenticolaceae bacterium]
MHPITHFLASWTVGDATLEDARDRSLATLCGVAPDLDGLGLLADGANALLRRPGTWYFGEYHHVLLHGLPAALLLPTAFALFARDRLRTFLVAVLVVHLHYVSDLIGSRGPAPDDLWPIAYLAPFSDRWTLQWPGQWPLNAWPNVLLTAGLIGYSLYRAVQSGYSPVGVISTRADRVFVETVRNRWRASRFR